MAHFATNRFNYWGQLGIFTFFFGLGVILLSLISIYIFHLGGTLESLDKFLIPENATMVRWLQLISTLLTFFLPPVLYAKFCHIKPFKHLGFEEHFNIKQLGIVLLIILISSPMVDLLQQLTEMLPWSKATLLKFKAAEDDYFKQVLVIARMNNFWDYIISMIMVSLLPAVFEETLFRGGLQNLLSRWFKMPVLAIIVTSIIFSAIHGSYLGFLSRFALSFVLGWIYYRTGNIWLNIIAHFFNNGMALTILYFSSKPGTKMDPSQMNEHYSIWLGIFCIAVVVGLFIYFEKISKVTIDRPGEEVLIPGYNFSNPFENDIDSIGKSSQP